MPKIKIDQQEVEVPAGATILDAARKLGIDIPTLCFLEGYRPSTSCLVCMVQVRGGRLVPSCATEAIDGMQIESETDAVRQVRKTALELLLSDHVGDCLAPCQFGCPARMNVPRMLRQIAAGQPREAIETVKTDIALPAVLGRVCPKPCEKVCRRKKADQPVAICELKRYVADVDLASPDPYRPECEPASGRHVAVVGGGPTGLAAAYYLARKGHAVVLHEARSELGGRLRLETTEAELARDVLDAEIAQIIRLGIEVRTDSPVDREPSLEKLVDQFDAVLLALGTIDPATIERTGQNRWGLQTTTRGIETEKGAYCTSRDGVFAAGNVVRAKGMVIRSLADGKEAAAVIDRVLGGQAAMPTEKPFHSRMGKISDEEMPVFLAGASSAARIEPKSDSKTGFQPDEAANEAARCLHCDCRALDDCKLRHYASKYQADATRYRARRAMFEQDSRHSQVVYEPGKCIHCGLCVEIATSAGEPLGLSFVGRGFDVRVGVPFDRSLEEALSKVADQCAAACPTAALARRDEIPPST